MADGQNLYEFKLCEAVLPVFMTLNQTIYLVGRTQLIEMFEPQNKKLNFAGFHIVSLKNINKENE